MNDGRDPEEDQEDNVDQEIFTTALLETDGQRWNEKAEYSEQDATDGAFVTRLFVDGRHCHDGWRRKL
jgi:hypothetical protein